MTVAFRENARIRKLRIFNKRDVITRLDLNLFLIYYAAVFWLYFNPHIPRDYVGKMIRRFAPDPDYWICWNPEMDSYCMIMLWFVVLGALVHIGVVLACYWNTWIRVVFHYVDAPSLEQASYVHAVPPPHNGDDAICPLQQKPSGEIFFVFQQVTFVWDMKHETFDEVAYPDQLPLGFYMKSQGIESMANEGKLLTKYGKNEFDIPSPEFWEVFQEHATAPFFLFQIFTVGLWCLDEYWKYSLFTLFMLVMFECTMVWKRLKNMSLVREMRAAPIPIQVYRR